MVGYVVGCLVFVLVWNIAPAGLLCVIWVWVVGGLRASCLGCLLECVGVVVSACYCVCE